jgi:hypothetical protein
MLKKDIENGKTYEVRWHDGSFTDVLVLSPLRRHHRGSYYGGARVTTGYMCKNLKTGRVVTIKSAAKFRREVGA